MARVHARVAEAKLKAEAEAARAQASLHRTRLAAQIQHARAMENSMMGYRL